jgi:hypothetical protein
VLGVAGFLFLGQGNGAALRQFGRYYGRMMRLKSELLSEFTRAADLPAPAPGAPVSIRQSLLEWEPSHGRVSGIPAAVTTAPVAVAASPAVPATYSPGFGPTTWTMTYPTSAIEEARFR